MFLQTLKLTNFKNYAAQTLDFSARLNCLTGLNGMGKTNILDAIHFLCLSKSHSGNADKLLVRQGEAFFRIDGIFEKNGDREQVVAKMQPPARKELERNGVPIARFADHIGQFPVVMIAPDDVRLVQEGSEERRRFLDATLSQIYPVYLSNLLIFNQLLRQRNALLKSFWEEKTFDAALLEAIDWQLSAPSAVIFEHRKTFVENFSGLFQSFYEKISGGRERVELTFESPLATMDLAGILQKNLEKDRFLQRTTDGPHRDDLAFKLDGQPAKRWASQGQLKSFLLALRLAQYQFLREQTGTPPILLLDDIFDKLDEQRVASLIGLLIENAFGQVFITDTHATRTEAILREFPADFKIFVVENGAITKNEAVTLSHRLIWPQKQNHQSFIETLTFMLRPSELQTPGPG